MNLVKTIFSAIAATKKLCTRIHFSGIVINVSGIAALIACQLQNGKLNTTQNFFCLNKMLKSWFPNSILICLRNLLERSPWGNQICGSHSKIRSRLKTCRMEWVLTTLTSVKTYQRRIILKTTLPKQSPLCLQCLNKWIKMRNYLKTNRSLIRVCPKTFHLLFWTMRKQTSNSQE